VILGWFGVELRNERGLWTRRVLWFGIAAGALLVVGSVGELLLS
jgi:hypothetical protein